MKITTDIMKDASEIIHYNISGLPILLESRYLSDYPDMRALCHWHEDIEFTMIITGQMNYYVNGKKMLLNAGDCIMVNSRQMHYGYSHLNKECFFSCLVFCPQLLFENTSLYGKYITPVLENQNLDYLRLVTGSTLNTEISIILNKMDKLCKVKENAYEIELLSMLTLLWCKMLQGFDMIPEKTNTPYSDFSAQKSMISYIHRYYTEKITLTDIATAGNVCRNKCCSIFKHYLQQTPINFLNAYRLEVSCHLLIHTSAKVSEIALACGFNHLSYYSKLFYKKYKYTPSQYRKFHLQHSE